MKSKLPLLLIILLALGVRLVGIQSRPIWYDEAFAILFSGKGLSAMLYGTLAPTGTGSADIHPLGYYTILWLWTNVFGQTLVAARALSILFSLVSLILIHQISLGLFDAKTAIVSAGVFSILPFQIHFAQEIRMYSALTMWLLLATLAFLRARSGNWTWWIVFAVSSAFAQYTHNLAVIYLIPLALTPLLQRDWKTFRSLVLAGLGAMLLYLPWLIQLPAQFSKVSASYWVIRPGVEKMFTLLLFYLPHLPLPGSALPIGLLIAVFTIALASFQTYLDWKTKNPSATRALWTAYLAFIPPLVLWLVSQIVPVYIERALLPSHAMFCIWLAWAFTQIKLPRPIQVVAFTLILTSAGMGIYEHVTYKGFPYVPSELPESIETRQKKGDVVIHSSKLSYLPTLYYNHNLPQGFIPDPPNSSVDTLAPATQQVLGLQSFKDIRSASTTTNASRVWFIIYQQSLDEYAQAEKIHPHLEYLGKHFELESVEEWGDLRVYLYIEPD